MQYCNIYLDEINENLIELTSDVLLLEQLLTNPSLKQKYPQYIFLIALRRVTDYINKHTKEINDLCEFIHDDFS